VGREEAVLRDPDVILIVTMGLSGESERQAWKRFPTVKAVKNGQIYLIDSDEVCSPTPVSFAKSPGDIAALLHPGEAKDIR
jgi:iron complex transport system substrate-binding protein